MPGRFSLYGDLSVEENLRFFASVFGTSLEEGYELIAPIYGQIEPLQASPRSRALGRDEAEAGALLRAGTSARSILLLDEPTTGVDAVSRREFWELLADPQGIRTDHRGVHAVHG